MPRMARRRSRGRQARLEGRRNARRRGWFHCLCQAHSSSAQVACRSDLPITSMLVRDVAAGDFVTAADVAPAENLQAVRVRREMEAQAQDSVADTALAATN